MATKRLEFEKRAQLAAAAKALAYAHVTVAELCAYFALESAEDMADTCSEGENTLDAALGHARYLIRELNPSDDTNEFWDMLSDELHPLEALECWKREHDRANAPDTSFVELAAR